MADFSKEYYLMHKDIPVCLMEISEDGNLSKVRRNESAAKHFPLGGQMNDMKFHDWWRDRAIPKTRHGAKAALEKLGYSSTASALVNNLALSLTDCYWIKPRGESITWKEVNLFSNEFVDTFGQITINRDSLVDLRRKTKFDCATSQGELQKKWCMDDDGRRYMVKGNYGQSYQQSINEVFATRLHEQQGTFKAFETQFHGRHAAYKASEKKLCEQQGVQKDRETEQCKQQKFLTYTPYYLTRVQLEGGTEGLGCMCYDYCSENVESISAWEILQTVKTKQNESYFHPFKRACLELGMEEQVFSDFMDYQIMTDYLLTNTDRHMNNISVLRNPDTLEILGFTPIYDSGNSMFYNVPYEQLGAVDMDNIRTHSFIEKESKLLQYVKNRKLVNLDRAQMDFSLYEQDLLERHMRIPRLRELYEKKCERLSQFQEGKDLWRYSPKRKV